MLIWSGNYSVNQATNAAINMTAGAFAACPEGPYAFCAGSDTNFGNIVAFEVFQVTLVDAEVTEPWCHVDFSSKFADGLIALLLIYCLFSFWAVFVPYHAVFFGCCCFGD